MHLITGLYLFYVIIRVGLAVLGSEAKDQEVLRGPKDGEPSIESTASDMLKIAIIGAGITGASTAHHMHQISRLYPRFDVTVFDTNDQVGGRIRSAYVHNNRYSDVECGAATFTEDDWCMKEAMEEVGLKIDYYRRYLDHDITVWDGHDLLVNYDDNDKPWSSTWWHLPKWFWRYGMSLKNLREMIAAKAESFYTLTRWNTSFKLPEELEELFSEDCGLWSASGFLEPTVITEELIKEIIEPETRYRHNRDLDQVNPLSSMLALRSGLELSIFGGNQRLPHRMLKLSEAQTYLNTRVTRITSGKRRRWKIDTQTTQPTEFQKQSLPSESEFDVVIITASFAFNGIDIDLPPSSSFSTSNVKPYVERHVTHFSTVHRLSPTYFNLPVNVTLPGKILTAPKNHYDLSLPVGKVNEIFSITVVDIVGIQEDPLADYVNENGVVYKIVSSQTMPDDEIARLVGHQPDDYESLESMRVSWVHRQAWPHAYPQFTPWEPILDNLEIAPDLYYTAAAEEVVSTMEMGCRMGRNVAKKLYYSKYAAGESIL